MNKALPLALLLLTCTAASLSSQCSLQSLTLPITDTATCGGPLTLTFTPGGLVDTTPVILSSWTISGFQNDFQLQFEAGDNPCYHVLTIAGKYTVWSETPQFFDAFYRFDTSTNQPLLPAEDYLQFPQPLFVDPPGYSPEHVYRLYYPGNGSQVAVSFADDLYIDNWGEMSFEWSVVPCIEYQWTVMGQTSLAPTFTHTFEEAGTYQVNLQATDLYHDCSLSTWAQVTIHPLPTAAIQTTPSCPEAATGSAEAIPLAGTPPFRYDWGSGLSASDQAAALAPGTYTLTLEDANGCMAELPFEIEALPQIEPQVETVAPTCPDTQDGILLLLNAAADWQLQLDGTPGSAPFTGLAAGTHVLTITYGSGCTRQMSVEIPPAAPWWVEIAGPTQPLSPGDTVALSALLPQGTQAESLSWTPAEVLSCTQCAEPMAHPLTTTTIRVEAISASGCRATDTLLLQVAGQQDEVFAPGAFTPNGDGINDTFTLFGGPSFRHIRRLVVMSRWGGTAWEAHNLPLNDPAAGWDGYANGRPAPAGVYVWMAEIERKDGTALLKKGTLTLVR